ncbi:MAG: HlyD family efflux transporter periplasmic adaptor subunit [Myxococcota bacterium]|nr:HlyD family efflux transporter periplasmic adaptor subunit [Myxococcota bacterium]
MNLPTESRSVRPVEEHASASAEHRPYVREGLLRRDLTHTPAILRWMSALVVAVVPVVALFMGLVPWQQSATGSGSLIAYSPQERVQTVEAPIDGRVLTWHVSEGQEVQKGELLVELVDNDPNKLERLSRKRTALLSERAAAEAELASKEQALAAKQAYREQVQAEYGAKIAELERKRVGEALTLETNAVNTQRVRELADAGIESKRTLELAELSEGKQEALLAALDQEISAMSKAAQSALASVDADIASARADVANSQAKVASVQGKVEDLDGELARQASQSILAPRDGRVLALEGAPVGGQVKVGDPLLDLVPETAGQAVALYLQGQDIPWVEAGDEVRLVFEGIPALQWIGPPGEGVGTYEGRIALIDASRSIDGFRVVVVPTEQGAWPDLPQGVRVSGFVLLGEVPLGWEVWRRVNAFPPDRPATTQTKTETPSSAAGMVK